jgi:hypothetical protein
MATFLSVIHNRQGNVYYGKHFYVGGMHFLEGQSPRKSQLLWWSMTAKENHNFLEG